MDVNLPSPEYRADWFQVRHTVFGVRLLKIVKRKVWALIYLTYMPNYSPASERSIGGRLSITSRSCASRSNFSTTPFLSISFPQ